MAGKFVDFLGSPWIKANGDVFAGTAYFYVTGSSTPTTVFANSDLTGGATSLPFNQYGICKAYSDGTYDLKIVVKDTDGVTISSTDAYDTTILTSQLDEKYSVDGSLSLQGTMDVNGYDLSNVGNIEITDALIVDHGGSFTQQPTDLAIFSDSLNNFSLRVTDTLDIHEDGNLTMSIGISGITLESDLTIGGDIIGDVNITGKLDVADEFTNNGEWFNNLDNDFILYTAGFTAGSITLKNSLNDIYFTIRNNLGAGLGDLDNYYMELATADVGSEGEEYLRIRHTYSEFSNNLYAPNILFVADNTISASVSGSSEVIESFASNIGVGATITVVAHDSDKTNMRISNLMVAWSDSEITYAEQSATDIGDMSTYGLTYTADISGSDIRILANTTCGAIDYHTKRATII